MKSAFHFIAALSLLLGACATQPTTPPPAGASKEAALQLLRREGIISDDNRVMKARWNGAGWTVILKDTDGYVSNWNVDAEAKQFNYICQH